MHNHQLLDHPLFEEQPLRDILEPFGFEVSIKLTEPPIDPVYDVPEAIDAYANDPTAYIDRLTFEHPSGFTEIDRSENDDGDIYSVAVRAKTVFAQLLLCADSSFAQEMRPHARSYADVYRERMRQLSTESWSREHDDTHDGGELSAAAGCYAFAACRQLIGVDVDGARQSWPWEAHWWKPSDGPRRNLVKAGALILAEIERLDRAAELPVDESCSACGSVPGQFHSPECPATNAFTAGRIPNDEGQGGEA
ncbi:hypothetical protein [Halomonas elongata]|uniref:Uncharacterized protein n=1 Tax=Halomonas elongata (strain ATCC 33173 / DSM 2581 / NBRC 15536 / NCIMB 2198 / 1H9) TaxID=768066 RepID=E1VAZ0_HALED|nr:hypothetical protein [Halomonas elongata]WBF17852.1 hypothetical protein LM502_17570 [Halomonas elongata]WPU46697.1 hypothetical protein SR933_15820 [Halomonas elongata DSM 2581]CBV44089.1 uncharacterized protein HELO_4205 [Halomonas elongata DSM 2581]